MSVMPLMPGAVRRPWPVGALSCPKCGNRAEILLGDVQNIEHYQCPCGFFSMRSGGYTAEVRGWNEDVKEELEKKGKEKMKKHYDIESAHGAAVELRQYNRANWSPFCNLTPTIEEARKDLVDAILSRLDHEDRGEEFENEWRALAERAQTADVGDVFAFDERGWRIVEVADEE